MQSDGDPDHDPIHILTGFCQAVAISVTFLGLYTPLVNIFETFTKAILTAIGSKGEIEAIKDQLFDIIWKWNNDSSIAYHIF